MIEADVGGGRGSGVDRGCSAGAGSSGDPGGNDGLGVGNWVSQFV